MNPGSAVGSVALCAALLFGAGAHQELAAKPASRPRLVVTTDGEVDDMNSFIRLLYYANEFEWEGIVITSSEWHYTGDGKGTKFISEMPWGRKLYGERTELRWTGIEWPHELIDLYAQVYPNLKRHASGYPEPAALHRLVKVGNITFEGEMAEDTEGSRWIENLMLDDTSGPLYIQAWGGANTIARALKSIEDRFESTSQWSEVQRRVTAKVVLILVDEQDATYRKYIEPRWPKLPVLLNLSQFRAVGYQWKRDSEPAVHPWLKGDWCGPHLKRGHGPLMDHYFLWGDGQFTPGDWMMQNGSMDDTRAKGHEQYDFISEGDSIAYLHMLPVGLRSLEDPTFGGWGGRLRTTAGPAVRWEADADLTDLDPHNGKPDFLWPVSRWVPAIQNDFAARVDWGTLPYGRANHPPVVTVDGPLDLSAEAGSELALRGRADDPDGNVVALSWWQYREAGTSQLEAGMAKVGDGAVRIHLPAEATSGQTFHFILEGTDDGNPPLTRYHRIIVTVN